MGSTAETVRIHYHRPPDRDDVFVQRLVHREGGCAVTYLAETPLPHPVELNGEVLLEPGAPAVWFTFEDARHDIGRFHRADGAFTGIYANILTPIRGFAGTTWHTTDLFLDIWLAPGRDPVLLDEDELDAAVGSGAIEAAEAADARAEAGRLMAAARAGEWPPAIVETWTLDHVLRLVGNDVG